MKCHGNAHDDEPFHMETYMAQYFNLYFCLRNLGYNEVVLCSSYLKIPFLCLNLYAFLSVQYLSTTAYLIFLFSRALWKFNFLYSSFHFYPRSLCLFSDRRASDRRPSVKKSKIDIAQKRKKKRPVENRNYRQSQVVRTFASE